MSAATAPVPTHLPDPALLAAAAELLQLSLTVARLAARLATVEDNALDTLATATAETASALATPPASLADALGAGRAADDNEAARAAAIARVATITGIFEKAARAVRRTVALHARLQSGPFPGRLPGLHSGRPVEAPIANAPAPRQHPSAARDTERHDRADRAEAGDELGALPDGQVIHLIHHDLARATADLAHPAVPARATAPAQAPVAVPGQPALPAPRPAGTPAEAPTTHRERPPRPDS